MKGVMLMAYGSPRSLDEVETYYTHIRGGSKPTVGQLADLVHRYKSIGGSSPLRRITQEQAAALQRHLRAEGSSTKVYAAMKHSEPFISEVVMQVQREGVDELLCIVLAPHYSHMSTGGYEKAVEKAVAENGDFSSLDFVKSWHTNPKLISGWVDLIVDAERKIGTDYWLVFTAHSLPERILSSGDPYKEQFLQTAGAVARSLGTSRWSYAFQSASATGEPWLGPDIIQHLAYILSSGKKSFLVAPIGFVADHLEILYDLDVECANWARLNGVTFARCDSFNATKPLIECLSSIVEERGFV